jgi:release factor glutamine methyltransferase
MPFGPLTISFDDRVLRPRPWTLAQSTWGAELANRLPDGPVVELCAGVGHIGLAVAAAVKRDVLLVDADPHAGELARENALAAGLDQRVEVRVASVESALAPDEMFPLMLVDPPWVPSGGTDAFPDDPTTAIDGGADGLDLARTCMDVCARHLGPCGAVLLQLADHEQVRAISGYLASRPELGLTVAEVRHPQANGVLVRLTHS